MSNKISRRSFLKCAGATALAAGAASMLSGCDLIGAAMNLGFEQIGNQMGHASATMGNNVWAALSNDFYRWGGTGELSLLAANFQVKNKRDTGLDFYASDITDIKIDGHKAKIIITPNPEFFNDLDKTPALFDANGKKTFAANPGMNAADEGYIFFVPDYDEGEEHTIVNGWKTLEFTFKLNGHTATFAATRSNGTVTSAKK